MIKLEFPLNVTLDSPRPIFKAYINHVPIRCMLDTGAAFMKMKYTIDCSTRRHLLTIEADRNLYGVGYYDKKETIYIFSVRDKWGMCQMENPDMSMKEKYLYWDFFVHGYKGRTILILSKKGIMNMNEHLNIAD